MVLGEFHAHGSNNLPSLSPKINMADKVTLREQVCNFGLHSRQLKVLMKYSAILTLPTCTCHTYHGLNTQYVKQGS